MKIFVSQADKDFYSSLISLLNEIKLTQGGTALSSTLRRHSQIKNYLIEKQKVKLKSFEEELNSSLQNQ